MSRTLWEQRYYILRKFRQFCHLLASVKFYHANFLFCVDFKGMIYVWQSLSHCQKFILAIIHIVQGYSRDWWIFVQWKFSATILLLKIICTLQHKYAIIILKQVDRINLCPCMVLVSGYRNSDIIILIRFCLPLVLYSRNVFVCTDSWAHDPNQGLQTVNCSTVCPKDTS